MTPEELEQLNKLGRLIKDAREKRGMTQEALAKRLNISRENISNWETGRRQVHVTDLHLLANALDTPVLYFFDVFTDEAGRQAVTTGGDERRMAEINPGLLRGVAEFVPEFEPSLMQLEPVGGAITFDSRFYIRRPADEIFHAAVARRDSIIRLFGPRQVGKTSLLARGLEQARQQGWRVAVTDFQEFGDDETLSLKSFFLRLARRLAARLKLHVYLEDTWSELLTPNENFADYVQSQILGDSDVPLVWGIDEADHLFDKDYRSSVFGLFRSWYNERALDPNGPYQWLTLLLTYSTEANLFIQNLNQSPFNVGTEIVLDDFTQEQVAQLNALYGNPLRNTEEIMRLYALVGGHPYLVRLCLNEIRTRGLDMTALEAEAVRGDGPFSDHLERIRRTLYKDPELLIYVQNLLRGEASQSRDTLFRLRAAGIILGSAPEEVRFRCSLYQHYLEKHLL
jgi:transcriptional regulator with XRE-family HTH domain